MNKLELIVVSLMATLATCSILFYGYKIIMYLYSMFGMTAVIGAIFFISIWVVWYLVLDD